MDVLCADKTGTLTENRVTVILHVDVEGQDSEKVFLYSLLNSRYQTGLKSPLDEAILKHEEVNTDNFKRIDEVPFDFVRKRLSVVVDENQGNLLITKGAPEEIFKIASSCEIDGKILELTDELKGKMERRLNDLSLRAIALSECRTRKSPLTKYRIRSAMRTGWFFLGSLLL